MKTVLMLFVLSVPLAAKDQQALQLTITAYTECGDIGGATICEARAVSTTADGKKYLLLVCNAENATCARLKWQETYAYEIVPTGRYPECGRSDKISCVVIHGRPYDGVYMAHISNQPE